MAISLDIVQRESSSTENGFLAVEIGFLLLPAMTLSN